MGFGSYTARDWSKLKESSKLDEKSSASQIFTTTKLLEKFDPKFVNKRESMDSEDHPNSTPIIIGLDTTGSMGYLSTEIAKNSLNETMMKIYATNPVEDPQLLFSAIGDVRDRAPLQVTQFESDIRIAEQLMELYIEGAGGDSPEDFELLWYFAAKHTKIDSFNKHGKKGFLFTIGDADIHAELAWSDIERIFGDKKNTATEKTLLERVLGEIKGSVSGKETTSATGSVSSKALFAEASKMYEIYHIQLNNTGEVPKVFNSIMPGRIAVLPKGSVSTIPELIISIMQLSNGMDKKTVLSQWTPQAAPIVEAAVNNMVFAGKKKEIIF